MKYPKIDNSVKEIKEGTTFVIDLIAAIRAMTNLPSNYEALVWHFVSALPKGFKQFDIVADKEEAEEADIKVILHCHHSLQENLLAKVVLRSPSREGVFWRIAAPISTTETDN